MSKNYDKITFDNLRNESSELKHDLLFGFLYGESITNTCILNHYISNIISKHDFRLSDLFDVSTLRTYAESLEEQSQIYTDIF